MAEAYQVLAGSLRLRDKPDGRVLAVLPRGQLVNKESGGDGAAWLKVTTTIEQRDYRGYVSAQYVMPVNPSGQSHEERSADLEVTRERLLVLAPTAKDWIVTGLAGSFDVASGILDTSRRLCHFLAQAAHESAGLRTLEEYGGPAYWARYDGRADLGNTHVGDGARYHGRGLFQLTGRANYRKMGAMLGESLEDHPDLAAEPLLSLRIACEYWKAHGLQRYADANDISEVTRRVNGSFNGFEERKQYYRRAWSIWGEPGTPAGV